MKFFSGLLAGVLLTTAVPVSAQSLGELAKKEQERRKSTPPPTKTYTNDDLKKLPPGPGSTTEGKDTKDSKDPKDTKDPKGTDAALAGDAAKADPTKVDASKPAEPAKDEAYWRGRIGAARDEVKRNEMFRDALQSRINGLTADFTARDDPYQRAQIADDRQKALAELSRVSTEITNGNKQVAAIEDEARRAGVPPGWIR